MEARPLQPPLLQLPVLAYMCQECPEPAKSFASVRLTELCLPNCAGCGCGNTREWVRCVCYSCCDCTASYFDSTCCTWSPQQGRHDVHATHWGQGVRQRQLDHGALGGYVLRSMRVWPILMSPRHSGDLDVCSSKSGECSCPMIEGSWYSCSMCADVSTCRESRTSPFVELHL